MFNFLFSLMFLFNVSGAIFMENLSIINFMPFANSIDIINENTTTSYQRDSDEFNKIIQAFFNVTKDSREMPAFGVSIHEETIKDMQSGLFIQFNFDGEQIYNNMPFESLLIKISPDLQGFNLIRKTQDKYQGRCFYLDLNGNMQELYNTMMGLISADTSSTTAKDDQTNETDIQQTQTQQELSKPNNDNSSNAQDTSSNDESLNQNSATIQKQTSLSNSTTNI